MKKLLFLLLIIASQASIGQDVDYILMSQKFLLSIKTKNDKVDYYIDLFANAKEEDIRKQLTDDNHKKTFFINLYNAYCNNALQKNPNRFKKRGDYFSDKQFIFAGNKISLDIIEHGFLRKSMVKLSMGKMHNLFPPQLEKDFRVEKVDYRIHFALNCGAKGCPKIDIYSVSKIDNQLTENAKEFLIKDSKFDANKNILFVTSLMSWFRGDFGDKKGVLEIHKNLKIIPQDANPSLSYKEYDWTLNLDSFK